MSNKRRQERIGKRYQVFFGPSGTPYMGFIKNLSEEGIAITSRTVFKPGTGLSLMLRPEQQELRLEGVVRWSYRPFNAGLEAGADMGIQFIEKFPEYATFFEKLKQNFKELRLEPRFEKSFRVTFRSPKEFMQAYTQNISLGGLFIQTEEPLQKDSVVEVEIDLEDVHDTIQVEGRVVFVITPRVAERTGQEQGVGVEIVKYFGDSKIRFENYLSRWFRGSLK